MIERVIRKLLPALSTKKEPFRAAVRGLAKIGPGEFTGKWDND